jgi:uncharacterized protein (DUF58 family)
MRLPLVPTRFAAWTTLGSAAAAIAALVLQTASTTVGRLAIGAAILGAVWVVIDLARSTLAWRRSPLQWHRRLPAALALGVPRTLACSLVNEGPNDWWLELFDHAGPDVEIDGLPLQVYVPGHSRIEVHYRIVPRTRGELRFAPAELRLRTLQGSFEWIRRIGADETLRVYPDFAAVSRYAWLARQRRLAEIGIESLAQRGAGTEFHHLTDYRAGEATRHVDWKATLKQRRPIVRRFQDERDQRVLFLLDCGQCMRAGEGTSPRHGSDFDQALNALMLLAYVALKQGDEVGAMTFGTDPAGARRFAPRKGAATLNALMALLHDVQPQAARSDYRLAARELMQAQRKRALVVVLTRSGDEDATELQAALKLLRSRHLVLLVDPRQSTGAAVELVNRYRAIKRAGVL